MAHGVPRLIIAWSEADLGLLQDPYGALCDNS